MPSPPPPYPPLPPNLPPTPPFPFPATSSPPLPFPPPRHFSCLHQSLPITLRGPQLLSSTHRPTLPPSPPSLHPCTLLRADSKVRQHFCADHIHTPTMRTSARPLPSLGQKPSGSLSITRRTRRSLTTRYASPGVAAASSRTCSPETGRLTTKFAIDPSPLELRGKPPFDIDRNSPLTLAPSYFLPFALKGIHFSSQLLPPSPSAASQG